jgi:hypothetical protein
MPKKTSTSKTKTKVVEFSDLELQEILGTAVEKMVRIAKEPTSEQEITTLSRVIEKCSQLRKNIA